LSAVHLAALPMFAVVMAVVVASNLIARAHTVVPVQPVSPTPRWDIPARMLAGTAIVLVISALAPLLGAYLAGLLSPFPVFAGVLTVFTHQTQGKRAAIDVLAGFLLGLASPAVFLLLVAVLVQPIGLSAFAVATAGALLSQGLTMRLLLQRRKVGQDLVAPRLHDVDDLTH
ncbi:MAG TPA: hypothetical protein VJU79_04870, partial [Candidatus Dormibacteraeota bacterium]|nr:hypothetical protein [Candidatus Dormibacteraeota bacterium]